MNIPIRSALDPSVVAATALQAQPGVFALLLGSGISTGAGIPTGWGVVTDLVRRTAAASAPEDRSAGNAAAEDPVRWWSEHGDGEALNYSGLLTAVTTSPSTRHSILKGYFEPNDEEDSQERRPTRAHRAIAELAKRGYVRVILTTNFDHLLEQALRDAGAVAQVLSRPEAVAGMTPLAHAPITLVKLHGDYMDLDTRNTVDELQIYPQPWNELLDRITAEYGLIISGWSGDSDAALVAALERRVSRRYPLFWDSRSSKGETPQRIIAAQSGTVVPANSADDLFAGLLDRVVALESLSESPMSTAIAVARLKRYLDDPLRQVDLEDLVLGSVERCVEISKEMLTAPDEDGAAGYQLLLEAQRRVAEPVLQLLSAGVRFDRDESHIQLWCDALGRLMDARSQIPTMFTDDVEMARFYPAVLALRCMGVIAVSRGHDKTFVDLLTNTLWSSPRLNVKADAAYWLHDYHAINYELAAKLPRWNAPGYFYPVSRLLRADTDEIVELYVGGSARLAEAQDAYEYRLGLLHFRAPGPVSNLGVATGPFAGEYRWGRNQELPADQAFRQLAKNSDPGWPMWRILGAPADVDVSLDAYKSDLYTKYQSRH